MKRQRSNQENWSRQLKRIKLDGQQIESNAMNDDDWVYDEQQFHLQQAKLRSQIRFKENRSSSFDLLLRYQMILCKEVRAGQSEELLQPDLVLYWQNTTQLEILIQSMEVHKEIEQGDAKEYWQHLVSIAKKQLLIVQENNEDYVMGIRKDMIDSTMQVIQSRNLEELFIMQRDILQMLSKQQDDIQYWEGMLNLVEMEMDKKQLHEWCKQKYQFLDPDDCSIQEENIDQDMLKYEPTLQDIDESIPIFTLDEYNNHLKTQRQQIIQQILPKYKNSNVNEVNLKQQQHQLHPRKPKYFNRIKTGYEWTKHNQAHYDHIHRPPKIVQGYKFNIFYPDLIDKSKTPQYYLEPDDDPNTCILRFSSGAPYEDIAFRIVNKEWDFTDRGGFKCFFDSDILHLYFNFKRPKYKR